MAKWIDRVLRAEETAIRARRLEQEVGMLHGSLQAMHNTITSMQASSDIETNTTDITDNKHYTGNKYSTYEDQVTALANKYNNTADWGCQTTKNIIDVRAAFCIGRGVQVKAREGFEGRKSEREIEFIKNFIHFNKMDDRKPSDWAKEAEIEGKVLFRFKFQAESGNRMVKVWHVPWRDVKYKVANTPEDYETYTRAWFTGSVSMEFGPNRTESVDITFNVGPEEFVFARFGGGGKDTTNTPSKTAFVLDQTENLDKELWDWRKINHLFAAPTPVFEFDAECADEARQLDKTLKTNNWRIGKYIVLAGGRFHLETYSGEGFTTIQKAIEADVQAISGSTGVPVHFLGHPNLLSNRATAENLMELIELSTDKERDTWTATYTEMFQKAIRMWNRMAQTDLNPDAVEAVIPFAGGQNLEALEKVYLPMYIAGAMSLPTLLSKLVGVDQEAELARIKVEREEKEAREMAMEKERAKNAAASSGGTTGNGRVGNSRDGGRDVAGRSQGD